MRKRELAGEIFRRNVHTFSSEGSLEITSKELEETFKTLQLEFESKLPYERAVVKRIIEHENLYIKDSTSICPQDEFALAKNSRPSNVALKRIHNTATGAPEKPILTRTSACALLSKLFVADKATMKIIPSEKKRITELRRIGNPSVMGQVFRGKIYGIDDYFLFKISNAGADSDYKMIHELVAGLHLNALRTAGIPNFSLVYGAFMSNVPIVDEKGNVTGWSDDDSKQVLCLMYEDLGTNPSATEYAIHATPQQLLSLILQTALGISSANRYYSGLRGSHERYPFTHYDLHGDNEILRKHKYPVFQIPYTSSSGQVHYVTADSIATTIDYGMTYVNGFGYPSVSANSSGQSNERGRPLCDIFKLLTHISLSVRKYAKDDTLVPYLDLMLRFFTLEDPLSFLRTANKNYFILPPIKRIENYTIENFVNYMDAAFVSKYPQMWKGVFSKERFAIPLLTTEEFYTPSTLYSPPIPQKVQTLKEYRDLIATQHVELDKSQAEEEIKRAIESRDPSVLKEYKDLLEWYLSREQSESFTNSLVLIDEFLSSSSRKHKRTAYLQSETGVLKRRQK